MPDLHKDFGLPTDDERRAMGHRIMAFIFPSVPRTKEEKQAFDEAVDDQISHEKTASMNGEMLPDGVQSFKIGEFSMTFSDGSHDSRLTKRNICPTAYGVLLRAGLLYKGVEGRW